jgi:tryptophan synthase alpha chain
MTRILQTFAGIRTRGRPGLIAYITAGYPTLADSARIVPAMLESGADIVEIGVPFSDPLADGATIQRSTQRALEQGVSLADCIALVADLRKSGVAAPLVLMGYMNPFLRYGLQKFFRDAVAAGVDGVIAVDATLDEADELREASGGLDIDLIQLVAPTTGEERMEQLLRGARGFVYCVSVAGTTGARGDLPATLPELVGRVRRHTVLPIAVGFGVSKREHVASIGSLCEAAVVGSAIVDTIENAPPDLLIPRLQDYVEDITGRQKTSK